MSSIDQRFRSAARSSERGMALLMVLMTLALLMALATALAVTTAEEAQVARSFRNSTEATHSAEAALARAMNDLVAIADWNSILAGAATSTFVDGVPSGSRTLADGTRFRLDAVVNLADCGSEAACSSADLDAVTPERPWGANNPRWQLFAFGRMSDLAPGLVASPFYVVVMAGDDPAETDDNPALDGGPPVRGALGNPGADVIQLRAEAFGPFGSHKVVEATVTRRPLSESDGSAAGVRVLAWRATT